jgi:hypothetical protein
MESNYSWGVKEEKEAVPKALAGNRQSCSLAGWFKKIQWVPLLTTNRSDVARTELRNARFAKEKNGTRKSLKSKSESL